MEPDKLIIAIVVLGFVASFGVGIMIWAYQGSGSVAVIFREVIPVPVNLADDALTRFQAGVAAYIAGQYRRAADAFTQVIQQYPDCAAAVHNLGLSLANQRQDDRAARQLLKAADLYFVQADPDSADLVKAQLLKLRQRKRDRESR